ncbi:peptidase M48 [Parafrankia colletiae]|uniref:Peptidase M48 n=1 Tax=Parafrankia colletiae TaxID=573497 RepID=A0A1S1RIL1_9ACTN|nr:M56 family metallopeptidase [Parafrankia colletiae]MCK9899322.1 M56 family metallopeptidase [Frankia sp. Cpl3]OHV45976.1 peptidase M48 [Parafrankia colletiae]
MTTAVLLALFACALAWPVPRILASARWPYRCPRAAIVLWQAIGLAGGVSALLAAVAFTVAPLSQGIPSAVADHAANLAAGEPLVGLGRTNLLGLAIAAALAARLFGVLCVSTAATLRDRHRHRHLVDLAGHRHRRHSTRSTPRDRGAPSNLATQSNPATRPDHGGRADGAGPAGEGDRAGEGDQPVEGCRLCEHRERTGARLRILDHPLAVAYCVPGVRHARVVVSEGLLRTLTPEELDAVLAHEEAHVNGRHDLVIQPFVAWERTFPFLRPAREATAAVSLLVEMLADDAAARRTSGRTLARALARLGVTRAPVPSGALGVTGPRPVPDSPATLGVIGGASRIVATMIAIAGDRPGAARSGGAKPGGTRPDTARPEPVRTPVVARISRLLDPPEVPIWLPGAAYLGAAAVFLTPAVLLLV